MVLTHQGLVDRLILSVHSMMILIVRQVLILEKIYLIVSLAE